MTAVTKRLKFALAVAASVAMLLSTAGSRAAEVQDGKPIPISADLKSRLEAHHKALDAWYQKLRSDYTDENVIRKIGIAPVGGYTNIGLFVFEYFGRFHLRHADVLTLKADIHRTPLVQVIGPGQAVTRSGVERIDKGMRRLAGYDAQVREIFERIIAKSASMPGLARVEQMRVVGEINAEERSMITLAAENLFDAPFGNGSGPVTTVTTRSGADRSQAP